MACTRNNWAPAILAILVAFTFLPARSTERDIYPAPDQAKAELATALAAAAARHRRVIVDFGGNWCTDCHVLDSYMHDSTNQPLVDANFFVVHINVGRIDQNLAIAELYGIPLKNGVPAIAVLSSHGKLLYSQTGGEFKDMRY